MHTNEAKSAIKLSVRPNYVPQSTHTGCECPTLQCAGVGESGGAESCVAPQCAVMGESCRKNTCALAGKVMLSADDDSTRPLSVNVNESGSAAEDAVTPSNKSMRGPVGAAEGTQKTPPSQDVALPQEQQVLKKSRKN